VTVWARQVADLAASADPQVAAAHTNIEEATAELTVLEARHRQDRVALGRQVLEGATLSSGTGPARGNAGRVRQGAKTPTPPNFTGEAAAWRRRADAARADLARIDALPIEQAAMLIRTQQEQAARDAQNQAPQARRPSPQPHPWFTLRPGQSDSGPRRTL
jgi:hypothetical protein